MQSNAVPADSSVEENLVIDLRPIKKPQKEAKKSKKNANNAAGASGTEEEEDVQEQRDVVSSNANETMASISPSQSFKQAGR